MDKKRLRYHKEKGNHRISVNNFAATINGDLFALINEGRLKEVYLEKKQNRLVAGPIGGGARITEKGKQRAKEAGGEDFHHKDVAFFVAPDHVERCKKLFTLLDKSVFEITITRELVEELAKPGFYGIKTDAFTTMRPAPLHVDDLLNKTYFVDTDPKELTFSDESRSFPGITTHYIWWLHHIKVADEVYTKLCRSDYVYKVTQKVLDQGFIRSPLGELDLFESLRMISERNKNYFPEPQ